MKQVETLAVSRVVSEENAKLRRIVWTERKTHEAVISTVADKANRLQKLDVDDRDYLDMLKETRNLVTTSK